MSMQIAFVVMLNSSTVYYEVIIILSFIVPFLLPGGVAKRVVAGSSHVALLAPLDAILSRPSLPLKHLSFFLLLLVPQICCRVDPAAAAAARAGRATSPLAEEWARFHPGRRANSPSQALVELHTAHRKASR
jgi:hypothetical protein